LPSIESFLELPSATSPAVGQDGKLFVWIGDEDGVPQLWARDLPDGQARRISPGSERVQFAAISPKSRDIVFGMDRGGDERQQLWHVPADGSAARPLTDAPTRLHTWGAWDPDGKRIAYSANLRDPRHQDVYVMDVATGEARCLLEGESWRQPLGWFPDGAALLVQDSAPGMFAQELLRLDVATGATSPLIPRDGKARFVAPKWKKDRSGFFLLTNKGREFHGLAFYELASGELRFVATPDRDIEALAVSSDERLLAYVANRDGWSEIVVRELASGKERTLEGMPRGVIASVAFLPDASGLVFPLASAYGPSAVFHHDFASGSFRVLAGADPAARDRAHVREPELVQVKSFDGRDVPAFLYRGAGEAPAGGRPALIIVHGGPESQYTAGFRADVQYLASQGWHVVAPNVRGSTGYGRTWQALDDKELRLDSVRDLKAVRDWTAGLPDVDASRVAVYGQSYGGYMVLAAITEYPDDWKAAVEFYGIADFRTLLETTGPWRQVLRAAEYGDPVEHKEFLERISPLRKVAAIKVPLFIAHGFEDPRVPPSESEMLVACMKGLGLPHEIIRVPHAGHGFVRKDHRMTVFPAVVRFLETHV
jgi:dipeptidyl aminopeptidase/acylaminoacyl peptidase